MFLFMIVILVGILEEYVHQGTWVCIPQGEGNEQILLSTCIVGNHLHCQMSTAYYKSSLLLWALVLVYNKKFRCDTIFGAQKVCYPKK